MIRYAVSEERFTRFKSDSSVPFRSLGWLTNDVGIGWDSIDAIAIAGLVHGDPPSLMSDPSEIKLSSAARMILNLTGKTRVDRLLYGTESGCSAYRQLFKRRRSKGKPLDILLSYLENAGYRGPIRKYEHHLSFEFGDLYLGF